MKEAVLIKQLSLLYTLKSFQSSKLDVQEVLPKSGNEKTQSVGMGNRFEAWLKSWWKLGWLQGNPLLNGSLVWSSFIVAKETNS